MSTKVRGIILRALFEPSFHTQLMIHPEEALEEYDLNDEEREAVINPSQDLYRLLEPEKPLPIIEQSNFLIAGPTPTPTPPPPPPTTVTVIVVVAITVFVAVTGRQASAGDISQYAEIISAIRGSSGKERIDLVKTLVNELTKDQ